MMKPVSEQPAQTRVLGLVDVIVRDRGISLSDTQAILEGVSGIATSAFPAHLLHGKRVEAMFGYVVAELDQCRLIKEEDAGETLVQQDARLAIPDYRIVTKTGRMQLIEVKNVHGANETAALMMRPDYVAALRTYGDLNQCPVLVAVYWSRWAAWTLVTLDDLKPDGQRLQLTFADAIMANRMGEVGDHSIGIRTPLRLRLRCDPVQLSVGQPDVRFRVRTVEVYCGETLLTSPDEQRLAFFLLLFGRWQGPAQAITDDQRIMTAVEFTAAPDQPMTPKQGFDIIGSASELLSCAYRHATVSADGAIDRLRPAALPVPITGVLPSDFRSDSLPVWRFTQV